jgi:hypothetical protein
MVVEGNAHDRARIVRRYLSALDSHKPGRTPARTAEALQHRMHQVDIELLSADPVTRLHLTQERIDLHAEQLRLSSSTTELTELEKAFVRVARSYGDRHEITFSAWRQVGVDAEVLAAAGIKNTKPARPQPTNVEPLPVADAGPAKKDAEPPKKAAAKKSPAKKVAVKKVAAAAKKTTAAKNGANATAKKAEAELPAEAHLLS